MSRLLAVLGKDVSASLSPKLHNAASAACQLGVVYTALNCPSESDFHEMIHALRVLKARGCNVTIPYKTNAFALADEYSLAAKTLGVANTLTFEKDKIYADNTDGDGLKRVIQDLHDTCLDRVQILGAGGAARAAAWAVQSLGAKEILVSARSKADIVAGLVGGKAGLLQPVNEASLVISSLPKDNELAHRALRDWIDVQSKPTILDLAYGNLDELSPLASKARALGLAATDGRGMLVEQAALSLTSWVGGQVSERIRKSMWEALGSRV